MISCHLGDRLVPPLAGLESPHLCCVEPAQSKYLNDVSDGRHSEIKKMDTVQYINEEYSEGVWPPAVALRPPPTVHLILPEPGVAQTPVSAQSLVRPLPQQLLRDGVLGVQTDSLFLPLMKSLAAVDTLSNS